MSKLLLHCLGYTFEEKDIPRIKNTQMVVILVHTTKLDGVFACILGFYFGKHVCIGVAKKFMDSWWTGPILSRFGCFAIKAEDGRSKFNTVDIICSHMKANPSRSLFINPEGRLIAAPWKSGFYHIANNLKIPIVVAGVDYINHKLILDENEFIPTGDYEKDLPVIQEIFRCSKIYPLYPEKCNPKIIAPRNSMKPSFIGIDVILNWIYYILLLIAVAIVINDKSRNLSERGNL